LQAAVGAVRHKVPAVAVEQAVAVAPVAGMVGMDDIGQVAHLGVQVELSVNLAQRALLPIIQHLRVQEYGSMRGAAVVEEYYRGPVAITV
jgi:hypothetical protein